ncbi:MAG: hypothetical protein ACFB0B_17215 [Thermonemataceae bacterium]
MGKRIRKIIGGILLGIGIFMFVKPYKFNHPPVPVRVTFIIVGSILLKRRKKKSTTSLAPSKQEEFTLTDEMIVRLAKMKNGLLTAQELASQTSLTVEQSKERLDNMHLKNLLELRVTDGGVIVYDFRDNHLNDDDKFNSKRVID